MSMVYTNENLSFLNDRIVYNDNGVDFQVMMDWERDLMKASANYVCQNGGDILEIGFGMGISAGYIQSNSINSHTIVENHPDVIERLKEWATDKPNVIIIEGGWYQNLENLSVYDGIFYDTFGDLDVMHFGSVLPSLSKPGGIATWWNQLNREENIWDLPNVEYDVYEVNPPPNEYFNHDKYYLPRCRQQL